MAKETKFDETKALQRFEGSMRHLKQHLQFIDCSLSLTHKTLSRSTAINIADALSSTIEKHPQMNIPCKKIDISRTIASSRIKVNEQAIVEVYRHFSNYIKNLIEEFVHSDPEELLSSVADNKDNILTFRQIVHCGDFYSVITKMADIIYRRFENERSTPALLDKILSYTKIEVDDTLKKEALMYLEIRHLIIHNNSKADDKFKVYSKGIMTLKQGDKIPINYDLTSKAIKATEKLCSTIDKQLVSKNMVKQRIIRTL